MWKVVNSVLGIVHIQHHISHICFTRYGIKFFIQISFSHIFRFFDHSLPLKNGDFDSHSLSFLRYIFQRNSLYGGRNPSNIQDIYLLSLFSVNFLPTLSKSKAQKTEFDLSLKEELKNISQVLFDADENGFLSFTRINLQGFHNSSNLKEDFAPQP